jgi:hypothetical protein
MCTAIHTDMRHVDVKYTMKVYASQSKRINRFSNRYQQNESSKLYMHVRAPRFLAEESASRKRLGPKRIRNEFEKNIFFQFTVRAVIAGSVGLAFQTS